MLDRHDCYELCVQSPRHVSAFLRAVHGNLPLLLREDFCGTAALARRWVADGKGLGDKAVAIDLDPRAIAWASARAQAQLSPAERARLQLSVGDCTGPASPAHDQGADVVFVGNFSIGYLHTRSELIDYLRRTRNRLGGVHGLGGGVFVCDIYGGQTAFKRGGFVRKHPGPSGETIHYNWMREEADPLTGMVENSISFRVEKDSVKEGRQVVAEHPRAFTYKWRLWSITELREAMLEAGFTRTAVYTDINIAPGEPAHPIESPDELDENWIVLIAAFTN